MDQLILGIDLGATNVRAGVVNGDNAVISRAWASLGEDTRFEKVVENIAGVAREAALAAGGLDSVACVGVGSPGPLDRVEGVVLETFNLGWKDAPLAEALSESLGGLPVWLENDAHAHAWGEFIAGAGKAVDDMVMLTLGSGVGGAIICNGSLLLGKDGTAGHIGAMPLDFGNSMVQGFNGTLEALCSARAVSRFARMKLIENDARESVLRGMPPGEINARAVHDAARAGDELALEVWESVGRYLGSACAGLANIFNTELIVIGGGMSAAWKYFHPHLAEEMEKRTWPTMLRRVGVVPAALGDNAGIIGAGGLARLRK